MVKGLNYEAFENAIDAIKANGTCSIDDGIDNLNVESLALTVNGVPVVKVFVQDTWDKGEKIVCLTRSDEEELSDYEIDGEYFNELHPSVEQLNSICEQIGYWY